ncbi:hypothetical protein GALL_479750 [mine drainage metagenome]|uniref:Uncharacterized protein n=1 Tax=mine drainage metagenome TaxID=410659 RepID=A0A1J5PRN6_9ZZZZ
MMAVVMFSYMFDVLRRLYSEKQSLREIGISRSIIITIVFAVIPVLVYSHTIIPSAKDVLLMLFLFAIMFPFVPYQSQLLISKKNGLLAEPYKFARFLIFQLPLVVVSIYAITWWLGMQGISFFRYPIPGT